MEPNLSSLAGQTITAGTRQYRVGVSRLFLVVPIAVATTSGEGTKNFEAPRDMLVEHITAWCSDSASLAAFRLGWYTEAGRQTDFYAPTKDDEVVFPVGSTFLTDAGIWRMDRVNLVFLKDGKRTFKAINVDGTAPYTVELTLHIRHLEAL